jgi:hypothetical protein
MVAPNIFPLDVCLVKSYILYKLSGQTILHKDFRRQVVDGLVAEKFVSLNNKRDSRYNSPTCIRKHKPHVPTEVRLTGSAHQPQRSTRRRCGLCSTTEKQVRTEWICIGCSFNILVALPMKIFCFC